MIWGFRDDSDGKESACSAGNPSSIPGLRRSPGERNGYPLQCSCLESSTILAWKTPQRSLAGFVKSQTQLSDDHFHFQRYSRQAVEQTTEYRSLESRPKVWVGHMNCEPLHRRYTCPSPGGASGKEPACQCRRHKRCRFNPWVGKNPWRRAWQPNPVFLPAKFHGQRNLVGYIQAMRS